MFIIEFIISEINLIQILCKLLIGTRGLVPIITVLIRRIFVQINCNPLTTLVLGSFIRYVTNFLEILH